MESLGAHRYNVIARDPVAPKSATRSTILPVDQGDSPYYAILISCDIVEVVSVAKKVIFHDYDPTLASLVDA